MEPISLLLETILSIGLKEFREHANQNQAQAPQPGSTPVTGEFRARFTVSGMPRPSLVMVCLWHDERRKMCVPVKYGEVLKLWVPRGIYQTTAWFFSGVGESGALPALVAIAQGVIKVLSNRPDKFLLRGHPPEEAEVSAIRGSAPTGTLPFAILASRALGAASRAELSAPSRKMLESPFAGSGDEPEPTLEIVGSAAVCSYQDAAGRRCPEPAESGQETCAQHSSENGGGFQIITWFGAPAEQAS